MRKHSNILQFYDNSQIGIDLAIKWGLRGHPKLIGFSSIANGDMKYDYLAPINIKLAGIDKTICVKVGPNQPNLLGLDILAAFNADVMISTGHLSVNPNNHASCEIIVRDFHHMLFRSGLSAEDIVTFDTLPYPSLGFEKLKNAGKSNLAVNVGFANSLTFFPHRHIKSL